MTDNNPEEDWMDKVENPKTDSDERYERFYYIWKKRIERGENPENASTDAPEGFTDWLKSNRRMIK